jgi:rhodanese-related sulfurtransferase
MANAKITKRFFSFIKPAQLAQQLASNKFTIIDVRENDSYRKAHIKGALNVTSQEFKEKKLQLNGDVVIHCQLSLIRGPSCAQFLDSYYEDGKVYLLDGGFKSWSLLYGKDPNKTTIG